MNQINTINPISFKEFEFGGWETLAADYGKSWGHITSTFIPAILRNLPKLDGSRLLDLATGPGYVTEAASELGANVSGIDFSPNMIAYAQKNFPNLDFYIADAQYLPFDDCTFDTVISNFGFQHFPDPSAVIFEAARVLKTGGILSFTVWAEKERNAASLILENAVKCHATTPSSIPDGPSYDYLLEGSELSKVFESSGLSTNSIKSILQVVPWKLKDPDELFRAEISGSVRSGAQLRNEPPFSQGKIRNAMSEDIRNNYQENGEFVIPMAAYIISGVKS